MILFYRIIPLLTGVFALAGFGLLWWTRTLTFSSVGVLVALGFCVLLIQTGSQTLGRWALLALPAIFLSSAFVGALFLQNSYTLMGLGVLVCVLLFFYNEHVFFYLHAPARYRAYALEYLSMMMALLSVFFLGVALFGLRMFLQIPIWLLCVVFMVLAATIAYVTFWSSKFDARMVRWFGFSQTLLLTETFAVLLFLPTGFYTNAAMLALVFYVTFGVLRAHLLQQLSVTVARRYLVVGSLLFILIGISAQWL